MFHILIVDLAARLLKLVVEYMEGRQRCGMPWKQYMANIKQRTRITISQCARVAEDRIHSNEIVSQVMVAKDQRDLPKKELTLLFVINPEM